MELTFESIAKIIGKAAILHNTTVFYMTGNDSEMVYDLKVCIIDVFKSYPIAFPHWSISTDIHLALTFVTPIYYEAFSSRYAG